MIIGGTQRKKFDVQLNEGRTISMQRIVLAYTYGGVLEGDPSRVPPAEWFEAAVGSATHHFNLRGRAQPGRGVALVEPALRQSPPFPKGPHVPYVTALAWCTSWHNARGTALALVWFQDSFDEPLFERFTSAAQAIDWDALAIEWGDD